jgi:hypothetical protein
MVFSKIEGRTKCDTRARLTDRLHDGGTSCFWGGGGGGPAGRLTVCTPVEPPPSAPPPPRDTHTAWVLVHVGFDRTSALKVTLYRFHVRKCKLNLLDMFLTRTTAGINARLIAYRWMNY